MRKNDYSFLSPSDRTKLGRLLLRIALGRVKRENALTLFFPSADDTEKQAEAVQNMLKLLSVVASAEPPDDSEAENIALETENKGRLLH